MAEGFFGKKNDASAAQAMTTRHSAFSPVCSDNERHGTPWQSLVRYSIMSDLFDVLSDATRRDIVGLLGAGPKGPTELSVGQLVEALGITQPTVSKHLKVLRESGLVAVREEGQHRYYRLDAAALAPVNSWLGTISPSESSLVNEPFVNLEYLGKATGGLLHDGITVLNKAIAGLRK